MNYTLETFVDELIKEKGFSGLDEAVLREMKQDLLSRIESRINALIARNIPEADREEFQKLAESDADDATVQKYCSDKIPNLSALTTIELAKFQSVYLGR